MNKLVLIVLSSLVISGCSSNAYKINPSIKNRAPVTWTKDSATKNEIEMAKTIVVNQLKDPDSAKFGDFWTMNGTNGNRNICGYVNAKNSYGGYTGKKTFTISNDSKNLIMESRKGLGRFLPKLCQSRVVK